MHISRAFSCAIVALTLGTPVLSLAAQNGIASGQIFGIQIGAPITLSAQESAKTPGEHSGSIVRIIAEKPADIKFLQIYKTPKGHIVTNVEGVSDFRSREQAMAFANKYIKLLPTLAHGFTAATTIDTTGEYPLEIVSKDWKLYVLVRDLKKTYGRTGYSVRIGLQAAYGTALEEKLSKLRYQESQEIEAEAQARAVARARKNGELKGLR
jgi:hypothetical protein